MATECRCGYSRQKNREKSAPIPKGSLTSARAKGRVEIYVHPSV